MHKLSNRPSKIRHDKSDSKNTVFEEDEIRDEEKFYENNYLKYHSTHQEESTANPKSIVNYSRLKNISLKGGESQSQSESVIKAQRIKLLEDVDKDYYKILKNTIKM
jgi:nitrate reductase beta subunit